MKQRCFLASNWVGGQEGCVRPNLNFPIDRCEKMADTIRDEPANTFKNTILGLEYYIQGKAPVQADGLIGRMPFYFRARHSGWSFTVAINPDIDPSCIWPSSNEAGFFQYDGLGGYYIDGAYGENFDASYMPYHVAADIILDCTVRFLADMGEHDR